MKVTDLLTKHRGQSISSHGSDLFEQISPSIREYWGEFVNKSQARTLLSRVRDFQPVSITNRKSKVDVNADTVVATPDPIVLKPEAQIVFDELQSQVGEVIHTGDWLSVDQDKINEFARVTQDMQWIHTDPEKAATDSPFKTTIAHGFLTLALLPKLTDSVDANNTLFPTAKMVVNIGLNQVRFPYPVKSGCNVRAKSTLTKVTPIKKGLEIEREIRVEIEGIRRPGCIAVSVIQLHF